MDVEPSFGKRARIEGYDIARAVAVLGMVVVNFKVAMGADSSEGWLGSLAGLLDGKAAATFVVLAGVGMSLMARRALAASDASQLGQVRRTLLGRALFLFVVGLAYTPLWNADILHFYGVYIALGAFVLSWSGLALAGVAAAVNVGFLLMLVTLDYEAGWNWANLEYEGIFSPVGMLRHLFFNGFHPVFPWLTYLLLGIWLGRQDLTDRARRLQIGGAGLAVVVGVSGLSRWLVGLIGVAIDGDPETTVALFGTTPMPPNVFAMLAGSGAAVFVIAAAIELEQHIRGLRLTRALVAAGQLALTLYVAHVVLGMGGLLLIGRLEGQSLVFALGSAAAFMVLAVVFADVWRARWSRGPLEAVMRRITG